MQKCQLTSLQQEIEPSFKQQTEEKATRERFTSLIATVGSL